MRYAISMDTGLAWFLGSINPSFPDWAGWNDRTLKSMYFDGDFWVVDDRSATDVSRFDYNEEW